MRQVSAIFWRSDQGGTARCRSICWVVRVWYSALSRMMTSDMSFASLLFRLDASLARQRRPFRNLARDIGGKLGLAVADDLGTLLAQPLAHVRQCQGGDGGIVQLRQHRRRSASRRKQRVGIVGDQRGKAGLGGGRDLRHYRAAPRAGDRE